jgi:CheY-like chemotaxis protein
VRCVIVELLNDLGFEVIEATDGSSGLETLQSLGKLDLLITDIGLPGLNGRQLAEAARAIRPTLKVLYMTGYADAGIIDDGFLAPGMELITKPFEIKALVERVLQLTGFKRYPEPR